MLKVAAEENVFLFIEDDPVGVTKLEALVAFGALLGKCCGFRWRGLKVLNVRLWVLPPEPASV